MAGDVSLQRLAQIRHIVVLMMENRSFDNMLGYLKRDGMPEVDGLDGTESNPDDEGVEHTVFEWKPGETVFHPARDPSGKILDPDHSVAGVARQLAGGNRGFITDYLATRRDREGKPVVLPPQYRTVPMGHYGAGDVPAYDFLARHYCVCDAWHCSVPGDTWPNRLFAVAGREGPRVKLPLPERVLDFLTHEHVPDDPPIYDVEAFTRQLADEQWRWYSHDPATLRAADGRYRELGDIDRTNFAYFDRHRMSIVTRLLEEAFVDGDSFLDDAARGKLREVSWIDPNFIDLSVLDPNSNDDHPPSDIRAGQALVLETYNALRTSPEWDDTLFVVVYDEHGGFYDHVHPPALEVDDGSGYATYGLRVPALVIGPRVQRGVCHELFDHTSLIKTILLRFAQDPDAAIASMGARVENAAHLGVVLGDAPRDDVPVPAAVADHLDRWRAVARAERRAGHSAITPIAGDGAGRPVELHEFQQDFARFAITMRRIGLPPGEP